MNEPCRYEGGQCSRHKKVKVQRTQLLETLSHSKMSPSSNPDSQLLPPLCPSVVFSSFSLVREEPEQKLSAPLPLITGSFFLMVFLSIDIYSLIVQSIQVIEQNLQFSGCLPTTF